MNCATCLTMLPTNNNIAVGGEMEVIPLNEKPKQDYMKLSPEIREIFDENGEWEVKEWLLIHEKKNNRSIGGKNPAVSKCSHHQQGKVKERH